MLAHISDVRRAAGLSADDTSNDAELIPVLEAAEDWVKRRYGGEWDVSGSRTVKFYNVAYNAVLSLAAENPTVSAVSAYASPGATAQTLVVNSDYVLETNGKLRLLGTNLWNPFEGATARFFPSPWARLEVTFSATASVPTPVREAVALIAAATWSQQLADVQGLNAETIGGYSYTRAGPASAKALGSLIVPQRAVGFLAPYRRRQRVYTTR